MSEAADQVEPPTTGDDVLDENDLSELLEREEFYVAISREFGATVGREFGATVGDHLEADLRRRLEESERVQRIVAEDEPSDDSEADPPDGRLERFKAWLVVELRRAIRRAIATVPELLERLTDDSQSSGGSGHGERSSQKGGSDDQTSVREQGDNDGDAVLSDLDIDAVPESEGDLESLSYRELQTMAKKVGIKANSSREQMIEQLTDELGLDGSS